MNPLYSTSILLGLVPGNWVMWWCATTTGQVAVLESSQQETVEDMRDVADLAQNHLWGVPPHLYLIASFGLSTRRGESK